MNAAKAAFNNMPKMPAGGGGAIGGLLAVGVGSVALYNSVVTGMKQSKTYRYFLSIPSMIYTHTDSPFNVFLILFISFTFSEFGCCFTVKTVQPGHLGVVYNRIGGLANTSTLKEGLNFVIPWFQRPVIFDIRTRPQLINTQSGSKDLQMVQISLRVLFKPNPSELPFIYRRLGRGEITCHDILLVLLSYSFIFLLLSSCALVVRSFTTIILLPLTTNGIRL